MVNLSNLSLSDEYLHELNYNYSTLLLNQTRKICLLTSLLIVLFGIVGHFLTGFVFSQTRFRTNPTAVFLLCLSAIDSLILVLYCVEEAFLPVQFFFVGKVSTLYLTNDVCVLFSFLRYSLRTMSTFVIVSFTFHRVFVVFSPLNKNLTNGWAWKTVALVVVISLALNVWTPFIFISYNENGINSCQVNEKVKMTFNSITIINICVTVFVPIAIIVVSNSLIIFKITRSVPSNPENRVNTQSTNTKSTNSSFRNRTSLRRKRKNIQKRSEYDAYLKIKPYYMNTPQLVNRLTSANTRDFNSRKLTMTLILTSFSYAVLNLPYCMISFYMSYTELADIKETNPITQNYVYMSLNISKVFYFLNYGIHFYIYSLTGSLFINQLKYSGKLICILKTVFKVRYIMNFVFIFLFAANNSKYPNIKFYAEVYTKKANETLNFNLEANVENKEEKEADLI